MNKNKNINKFKLQRKLGKVFIKYIDSEKEIAVKIVWARPVSGRGEELSILTEKGKELETLAGLNVLEEKCAVIATEELEKRYLIPKITQVKKARTCSGNRYMEVETDRGSKTILIKDPNSNVIWFTNDRLMIRDTLGNRFEILSLTGLSNNSQKEIDKII